MGRISGRPGQLIGQTLQPVGQIAQGRHCFVRVPAGQQAMLGKACGADLGETGERESEIRNDIVGGHSESSLQG